MRREDIPAFSAVGLTAGVLASTVLAVAGAAGAGAALFVGVVIGFSLSMLWW